MARARTTSGDELWLGYDELIVPMALINALLVYQSAWDRRIAAAYGSVPGDVRTVVLLHDGRVLPSRRELADVQARWADWRARQHAPPKSAREEGNE